MIMNYHSVVKFYENSIKVLIFAVPFLSLVISRSMLFPYITGRNFWFRILVEIALVLWIGLVVLDKEARPKLTPLFWIIGAFVLITGLADLLGADPYTSFWSRYERMEGYLLILHLAAYFVMLGSVLKTKKDWLIFFNIFIVAGLLVGGYALLQRLNLLRAIQGGRLRVDGTIGNPTYLAGYMIFIVALAVYLFSIAKSRFGKWYYGIAAIFFFIIIYFTASRGPILGLGAAALFLPFIYLFKRSKSDSDRRYKKWAAILLAAAVILPTGFWLMRDTSLIKSNPTFSRLASISLTEKTTRSRFMIWNMAWQGFKERPILGWGQENFPAVFAEYYNPKLYDQEPWFDRAHNIIFDWLINGGALGFLSYLSIFGVALWMIWQSERKGSVGFFEASIISAAFLAYFLQNIFVFDNFNTYILFFALLAYINGTARFQEIKPNSAGKGADISVIKKRTNNSFYAALSALAIILFAGYYFNVKPMRQSLALIDALRSTENKSADEIISNFNEALALGTFGSGETTDQLVRLTSEILGQNQIAQEIKEKFIKASIDPAEKQVKEHPGDLKNRLSAITLYLRSASFNPDYLGKAKTHLDIALKLSPTRQTNYFALADYYLILSDFDSALKQLKKAVELEPSSMEAQINLGRIAIFSKNDEIVKKVIGDIRVLAPSEAEALTRIADTYVQTQQFGKAIPIYETAVDIDFQNPRYRFNLATLYLNQGQKSKAISMAKKAAELDPANFGAKVEEFLNGIK